MRAEWIAIDGKTTQLRCAYVDKRRALVRPPEGPAWLVALERVPASRAVIYLTLVAQGLWLALTGHPRPQGDAPGPRRRRASAKTASNMGHVSLRVCVF